MRQWIINREQVPVSLTTPARQVAVILRPSATPLTLDRFVDEQFVTMAEGSRDFVMAIRRGEIEEFIPEEHAVRIQAAAVTAATPRVIHTPIPHAVPTPVAPSAAQDPNAPAPREVRAPEGLGAEGTPEMRLKLAHVFDLMDDIAPVMDWPYDGPALAAEAAVQAQLAQAQAAAAKVAALRPVVDALPQPSPALVEAVSEVVAAVLADGVAPEVPSEPATDPNGLPAGKPDATWDIEQLAVYMKQNGIQVPPGRPRVPRYLQVIAQHSVTE